MSDSLTIQPGVTPPGFSRGYATRDNDGMSRAANEPRRAEAKIAAGQTTTNVVETNTNMVDEPLASGWDFDAEKRITVRRISNQFSSTATPVLDIFVGDEIALIDSGAPATTAGYGWKELANGDLWFRYEGVIAGLDSGSANFPVNTPGVIRAVDDFGDVIPQLRNGAKESTNSLVLEPSYGSVYYGLVCLGCTANRYINGAYSDTNGAVFSTDGLLSVFWQIPTDPNDPSTQFVRGRVESEMFEEGDIHGTGAVRYDIAPGRTRYKVWAGFYPSLPGKTTTTRQDNVFLAGDDYLVGSPDVGGVDSSHGGIRVGHHVAISGGDWDLANASTVQFKEDRTADPDSQQWHNHASLMGSVMDGGVRRLYMLSVLADDFQFSGIGARLLKTVEYDPDNINSTFLTDFADPANWSQWTGDPNSTPADEMIYLFGNAADSSVTAVGRRLMRPIPGNEDGKTLIFSDDTTSRVAEIEWTDTSEAPRYRTVAGSLMTMRTYAFWAVQRSPGINGGEMLAMTHVPGGDLWLGDATRGFTLWYSPDGEAWGSVETPVSDLANSVTESWHFGTGGRVLVGSLDGIRRVNLPTTKKITPVPLARGVRNLIASDASQTQNFGGGTPTELSRGVNDGAYEDGAIVLPRDLGESGMCVKYQRDTSDGNSSVLFNAFDAGNVSSYDNSALDPGDSQLTFIYNVLISRDGWPNDPIGTGFRAELTPRVTNSSGLNNGQFPDKGARMVVETETRAPIAQDTERWHRQTVSYPHGTGGQPTADITLRTKFDSFPVDSLIKAYIIHEQCYQGRGWPGAPLPPEANETANPETITLGWDFADGDTIFGVCFIPETLDPKTTPMFLPAADTQNPTAPLAGSAGSVTPYVLDQVEAEAVLMEIGDPATNNYLSISIVWDSFHDSASFNAPQIRIRGKVGGAEITPSDTRWQDANGVKPRLGPGDMIAFRVTQNAINGPSVSCLADGIRVTTADVGTLTGQPTMPVDQVGADIANQEHAMEFEWGLLQRASADEYVGDDMAFARLDGLPAAVAEVGRRRSAFARSMIEPGLIA